MLFLQRQKPRHRNQPMHTSLVHILIVIIALLVVIVAVLLWSNLLHQRELRRKNEAIIREIRENVQLRDELRHRLVQSHSPPPNVKKSDDFTHFVPK